MSGRTQSWTLPTKPSAQVIFGSLIMSVRMAQACVSIGAGRGAGGVGWGRAEGGGGPTTGNAAWKPAAASPGLVPQRDVEAVQVVKLVGVLCRSEEHEVPRASPSEQGARGTLLRVRELPSCPLVHGSPRIVHRSPRRTPSQEDLKDAVIIATLVGQQAAVGAEARPERGGLVEEARQRRELGHGYAGTLWHAASSPACRFTGFLYS